MKENKRNYISKKKNFFYRNLQIYLDIFLYIQSQIFQGLENEFSNEFPRIDFAIFNVLSLCHYNSVDEISFAIITK